VLPKKTSALGAWKTAMKKNFNRPTDTDLKLEDVEKKEA